LGFDFGGEASGEFEGDGLTSSFLNDARSVVVGLLDEVSGRELLGRGLDASGVELVWGQVLGFAFGLQVLGDAVWRAPENAAGAVDVGADELGPTFRLWWRRPNGEKDLLRRGLEGVEVAELSGAWRRRARVLETRGLLVEREGKFEVAGELWGALVGEG
jgi:hypothetical protein